ncbi:MAG: cytochrome b N-terminal domain-containing protein [bacterium]
MADMNQRLFWERLKRVPENFVASVFRHGKPDSDRARSQAVFANFFLHVHSTRVHPHALRATYSWGLGVSLVAQFLILTATGVLLMVYYNPSIDLAYNTIKDIHYVVPTGRFIRNIHRWAAHLMVLTVILHMARVFYTASYKPPREFNWVLGMVLFILTLALSFSGYLLPWDQLAYWAVTIAANIAASPDELVHALGLPSAFGVGWLIKELMIGARAVGQEALTRFYMLHVMVLPLAMAACMGAHVWRIHKDGGLSRPGGSNTPAGKGVETANNQPVNPEHAPTKTYGLMGVVRGRSPYTGALPDETVPAWPYLLRAELLVFMINMLVLVALAYYFDAPLKEQANPAVPENPAKAPWYFLGLQEMVSYSAFVGGMLVPMLALLGLILIPFIDRDIEECGVWFSGRKGKRIALYSLLFGGITAVAAVAFPVQFGWLRNWFPAIPQIVIILINPGSLLTAAYAAWSIAVLRKTRSTRMGAIALFTCFLIGFAILTYVGTELRGPNWGFYWSESQWPAH